MNTHILAEQAQHIVALGPGFMDPEFWLSGDGPFGDAILPALLAVVFIESGLLFPFLPGDSLLFTAFSPRKSLRPAVGRVGRRRSRRSSAIRWATIGNRWGHHLQNRPDGRIFKQAYITEATSSSKWGPATIILCRFVPSCARTHRSGGYGGCATARRHSTSWARCSGRRA